MEKGEAGRGGGNSNVESTMSCHGSRWDELVHAIPRNTNKHHQRKATIKKKKNHDTYLPSTVFWGSWERRLWCRATCCRWTRLLLDSNHARRRVVSNQSTKRETSNHTENVTRPLVFFFVFLFLVSNFIYGDRWMATTHCPPFCCQAVTSSSSSSLSLDFLGGL